MGLAEIEKEIDREASAEAVKIKAKGQEEAARIVSEAHAAASKLRHELLAEAAREAEEAKLAIVVPARLEAKKKMLAEKHRILDELFAGLSDQVRQAKEAEAIKILYG
jgi:vacuolar-type H+-ATPase subunit E/Vma4